MSAAYGFPEIVDELILAGAKINSVIEAAGAGNPNRLVDRRALGL